VNILKSSAATLLLLLLSLAISRTSFADPLSPEAPVDLETVSTDKPAPAPAAVPPTVTTQEPVAPNLAPPPPAAPPSVAPPAASLPVTSEPRVIPAPAAITEGGDQRTSVPPDPGHAAPKEPVAPSWQTTSYLLRVNLGMNSIGKSDVETSGGLELVLQGPILAFSFGFEIDDLPGASTAQYAFSAAPILRLVMDNDDYFIGPRVGYLTISAGSDTTITGGEYGFMFGTQWGTEKTAFGLLFVATRVVYTQACSAGRCDDVRMDPAKCIRIAFTLAI
jgi:hypothetical protein